VDRFPSSDAAPEALYWAGVSNYKATDDASVVEMYGHAVALYEGEPQNLKLTTPTDLSVAEMILVNGTHL
jgi:2-C-methyl-D-erythritol 4-phosphate cytidylyltransferase